MNNQNISIFAPNIVCNCIDSRQSASLQGRIYHSHSKEPFYYKDVDQMLLFMDDFFECINFPMASTQSRSFKKTKGDTTGKGGVKRMQDSNIANHKGNTATFVVQVQYRQNSTWQGKVVWADQNKTLYFRSALELIRLIDSAVDEGGAENRTSKIGIATESQLCTQNL